MSKTYLEYPSAGLIPRIAAMGYDLLILLALWMIIGAIHMVIRGETGANTPGTLQFTLFPALLSGTFLFYFWFWTHGGQTLGMRAWRLKVVHAELDGRPITLSQCIIRFLVGICSLLVGGLGYFWVLLNSDRDTWHDLASHTRTLRTPKKDK